MRGEDTEDNGFKKAKDLKLQTKKSAQKALSKSNVHPRILPMHRKLTQTTNQLLQFVPRRNHNCNDVVEEVCE